MNRHTILVVAAVAAVAYAFGYYRAQQASIAKPAAGNAALATGTDWLNWQAGP